LPDGDRLFVAEANARRVDVVDLRTAAIVASAIVPARPSGVAFDSRRNLLYVTCDSPAGTVCALDAVSYKIAWTRAVGHTPLAPSRSVQLSDAQIRDLVEFLLAL
jgi:DNA-binding beta-propeller fold protein YncE